METLPSSLYLGTSPSQCWQESLFAPLFEDIPLQFFGSQKTPAKEWNPGLCQHNVFGEEKVEQISMIEVHVRKGKGL